MPVGCACHEVQQLGLCCFLFNVQIKQICVTGLSFYFYVASFKACAGRGKSVKLALHRWRKGGTTVQMRSNGDDPHLQ
jgi:hypothetical protein